MAPLCLWIASFLIYEVYSQAGICTNSHSQSLLLSVSIHGRSVHKIGVAQYLSVVENAVKVVLPSSAVDNVGLNTFGGVMSQSAVTTKSNMGSTAGSTIHSSIQGLISENFDSNYGNQVSAAVDAALTTSFVGQKYHILFSAGMPLANGWGSATTLFHFDDPCSKSITAKQNNIQQFVVLIGVQGANYVKEYFTCMVEDESDIIEIDPDHPNAGIAELQSRVCHTNGIDVKITEVNPTDGAYRPFVEVLNRGAPTSISVCWGTNTCSSSIAVDTGTFYVGYGSGSGIIPSPIGASVVAYWRMGTNDAGASGWTVRVLVNGVEMQSVSHGSDNYWQTQITGQSFELRAVGYNNAYGANWRTSCYPNKGGSPGVAPIDCVEENNGCTLENCALNGASTATCVSYAGTNSLCECPASFLGDVQTCIVVPLPTTCTIYMIADDATGQEFTYFTWDRVRWDGPMDYSVTYPDNSGTNTVPAGGVSASAQNDVHIGVKTGAAPADITVGVAYVSPIQASVMSDEVDLTCTVITMSPVYAPTDSPTRTTTKPPTKYPTRPPTRSPSAAPSSPPSAAPSSDPTATPTDAPTETPTSVPTSVPTPTPTYDSFPSPTDAAGPGNTHKPTPSPTISPTEGAHTVPSKDPTVSACSTTFGTYNFVECVTRFELFDDALLSIDIDAENEKMRMILQAPSDQWFGVGFGGSTMDGTYAIIVSDDEGVISRVLGAHVGGDRINDYAFEAVTTLDVGSTRMVCIISDWSPQSNAPVYSFTDFFECRNNKWKIPVISAQGFDHNFGYHGANQDSDLELPSCGCGDRTFPTEEPTTSPIMDAQTGVATYASGWFNCFFVSLFIMIVSVLIN